MADVERTLSADETVVSADWPAAVVRVRYWAAAKAAAGAAEEAFEGASVADVVAAAKAAHAADPRFARIIDVCSLLLDERPMGTSDLATVRVEAGQVIDVLPPFAGG